MLGPARSVGSGGENNRERRSQGVRVSLRTMSAVAVQREAGPPRKTRAEARTEQADAEKATIPQSWGDLLVSAIPSEVLGVYTPLIGVIVGTMTRERASVRRCVGHCTSPSC
jgi:hypothetical protein